MGSAFERPAFWILLIIIVLVVVVVTVIVLAVSRGGRSGTAASAPQQPANAPGWYRQPDGTQRYWDGRAWTEHTAP